MPFCQYDFSPFDGLKSILFIFVGLSVPVLVDFHKFSGQDLCNITIGFVISQKEG